MSDERLDLTELEWMWTKYAENGGIPLDELQTLEKAHDELKRWRATHSSGDFNPDWCAASDALKEHLSERAEMLAAIVELRGALGELADLMDDVREGEYKPDSFTNQPARQALNKTKKWIEK